MRLHYMPALPPNVSMMSPGFVASLRKMRRDELVSYEDVGDHKIRITENAEASKFSYEIKNNILYLSVMNGSSVSGSAMVFQRS